MTDERPPSINASLGLGLARRHRREYTRAFEAKMQRAIDAVDHGSQRKGPTYRRICGALRSALTGYIAFEQEVEAGLLLVALFPAEDMKGLQIVLVRALPKKPRQPTFDHVGIVSEHACARMHQRLNCTEADYAKEMARALLILTRLHVKIDRIPERRNFELPTERGALLGVYTEENGFIGNTWVHDDQLTPAQRKKLLKDP